MKLRTALLVLLPAAALGGCGTFLLPHPQGHAGDNRIYWGVEPGMQTLPVRNAQGQFVGVIDSSAHVPPGFRDPPPPPPPPKQQ
jgi:hypothetical protein